MERVADRDVCGSATRGHWFSRPRRDAYRESPPSPETLNALPARARRLRVGRKRLLAQLDSLLCLFLLASNAPELDPALYGLCESLLEYVSLGHALVFVRLASPAAGYRQLQGRLLRQIGGNTDLVLAFNARVEDECPTTPCRALGAELRKLHAALKVRFALEEQLLELAGAG